MKGRRGATPFDTQKAALFYRRSEVEKQILDVVKLLAYNADAVAGGIPDESAKMHAELDTLSCRLREIDEARWTVERKEREAGEAVTKIVT